MFISRKQDRYEWQSDLPSFFATEIALHLKYLYCNEKRKPSLYRKCHPYAEAMLIFSVLF